MDNSTSITWKSAGEVARAISEGSTSSLEVASTLCDRIAELNPVLNAIVTHDRDAVLEQARRADQLVKQWRQGDRSIRLGPFHGVPISVKDNIAVAGVRTTAGHPALAQNVPSRDAAVVERMRDAGAIILGKTNLSQLAMDLQTGNPIFGTTVNPYDRHRTPGGSSGGEAAAVAAGMSYLGIGNDLLHSVRLPAHYCGLYSYLPTSGLVPLAGFVPSLPVGGVAARVLRHGVLARSADDIAAAVNAIAGPHPDEPWLVPFPLTPDPASQGDVDGAAGTALDRFRFAVCTHAGKVPISGETERIVTEFADRLRNAGSAVIFLDTDVSEFDRATRLWARFFSFLMGRSMPGAVRRLAGLANRGLNPCLDSYLEIERERDQLIREIDSALADVDMLITPVSSTSAFPIMSPTRSRGPMKSYGPIDVDGAPVSYPAATCAFGFRFALSGHPVATVPAGMTSDGLPAGVQVIGRRWDDQRLLQLLQLMDGTVARFTPPDW